MTAASPPRPQRTKTRDRILNAIRDHITAHGWAPTLREIAAEVGLASPSAVAYQLDQLEHAGLIRRDPPRPRALALTQPTNGGPS